MNRSQHVSFRRVSAAFLRAPKFWSDRIGSEPCATGGEEISVLLGQVAALAAQCLHAKLLQHTSARLAFWHVLTFSYALFHGGIVGVSVPASLPVYPETNVFRKELKSVKNNFCPGSRDQDL